MAVVTQVTIHRDIKTKLMTCPCGGYSHKNSAAVRKHAADTHKGSAAAMAPGRSSTSAIVPASDADEPLSIPHSVKPSTSSKSTSRAAISCAAVARAEVLRKERKEHSDTSDATDTHYTNTSATPSKSLKRGTEPSTTESPAGTLANHSQSPTELKGTGHKAKGVPPPRDTTATTSQAVSCKRVAQGSIGSPSTKFRRVDIKQSASASMAPSNTQTSSSVSKQPAKKAKRLSAPVFVSAFTPSKLSSAGAISASRATVPSKRVADEVSEAPPPKIPRVNQAQTSKHTKKANLPPFTYSPLPIRPFVPLSANLAPSTLGIVASESSAQKMQSHVEAYPRSTSNSSSSSYASSATASGAAPTPSTSPHPTLVTRSPQPPTASNTPEQILLPDSEPGLKQAKCISCGDSVSGIGKKCSICQLLALGPKSKLGPPPAQAFCASCGTKTNSRWDKCTMCQMRALAPTEIPLSTQPPSNPPASDAAGAKPPPPAPKPRAWVTKKTRELFEQWFTNWTHMYRTRAYMSEPWTDQWREIEVRGQHGTTYPTPEAFLDGFRACLAAHRAGGAGGEVLQFYGAYSIVAHPRIGATARLAKLKAKLSEMGFELDGGKAGLCKFTYMRPDGMGLITIDDVYKYPCPCGGVTVPPELYPRTSVRVPDAAFAGPCGGTVMLIVGDDDALKAYGTNGQWIAVDIVH
ncbi:hypothetical protein C8Q80DRAFT_423281 [Daedaleopsis nitida]|nr:hypothetical protein C8Q80DRAFT_423281 [Daedaleopsis nitida]